MSWFLLTGGTLLNLDHIVEIPTTPPDSGLKVQLEMSNQKVKHVSQSYAAEIREKIRE